MKRHLSVAKILSNYDSFGTFDIHTFDENGKRILSYGMIDPLYALAYIAQQLKVGRQIIITGSDYRKELIKAGVSSSSRLIEDYRPYKIDFQNSNFYK